MSHSVKFDFKAAKTARIGARGPEMVERNRLSRLRVETLRNSQKLVGGEGGIRAESR